MDWGPRETTAGAVPNPQPGGYMGIWIKVEGARRAGDLQLMFGDQPAFSTSVEDFLVSAAVDSSRLASPATKKIYLKQTSSAVLLPIGTFTIRPAK